ncbi:hypothetical protein Tco_0460502, partial [Tanacetum coccineum]
ESVEIIREIVEEAKVERPLDRSVENQFAHLGLVKNTSNLKIKPRTRVRCGLGC